MLVKVGHINFLNVLPLNYFYATQNIKNFSLTQGVPAFINAKIKNNLLDVSLISSIEYARQSQNLILLPKICIRADEKVTSIILVSHKKIDELDGEHFKICNGALSAENNFGGKLQA